MEDFLLIGLPAQLSKISDPIILQLNLLVN